MPNNENSFGWTPEAESVFPSHKPPQQRDYHPRKSNESSMTSRDQTASVNAGIVRPLADIAAEINRHHSEAVGHFRRSLEHARQAGDLLRIAKAQIPHGGWLDWLTKNTELSKRTAQQYLLVAENWDAITTNAPDANLTIKQAVRSLAKPKAQLAALLAPSSASVAIAPSDPLSEKTESPSWPKSESGWERLAAEDFDEFVYQWLLWCEDIVVRIQRFESSTDAFLVRAAVAQLDRVGDEMQMLWDDLRATSDLTAFVWGFRARVAMAIALLREINEIEEYVAKTNV